VLRDLTNVSEDERAESRKRDLCELVEKAVCAAMKGDCVLLGGTHRQHPDLVGHSLQLEVSQGAVAIQAPIPKDARIFRISRASI
jgi:hypothetical protein